MCDEQENSAGLANGKSLPNDGWIPVVSVSPLDAPTLAETLAGGQCFRWFPGDSECWHGVTGGTVASLRLSGTELQAQIPAGSSTELRNHLATDFDWIALADRLPWRSDPHLARCIEAFPGLRILRQPFGETLLCFLCSATKQIVQIQAMVQLLAGQFGRPLCKEQNALPTWEELAQVSESALRACKLGFRAKNVVLIAKFLASRPRWLDETAALPYLEAKSRLMELPGVGAKVADCVLLFGAGKLEAFPVDVWILRALRKRYGLDRWPADAVAHFGRVHFGPLAGLAQQYLFAWERRFGGDET